MADNKQCMLISVSLSLSQKCSHSLFSLYDHPPDPDAQSVEAIPVVVGKYCSHGSNHTCSSSSTRSSTYSLRDSIRIALDAVVLLRYL